MICPDIQISISSTIMHVTTCFNKNTLLLQNHWFVRDRIEEVQLDRSDIDRPHSKLFGMYLLHTLKCNGKILIFNLVK